jgi:hypothetical protein
MIAGPAPVSPAGGRRADRREEAGADDRADAEGGSEAGRVPLQPPFGAELTREA